jgi:putative phosphoesterase
MDVALISDTHIPGRAEEIPSNFRHRIAAADHVVHAGDFETEAVLREIRTLATELTAVYGNADPGAMPLPAVDSVTVADVAFVVTHGNVNHVQAAVNTHRHVLSEADWLDAAADTARARAGDQSAQAQVIGVAGHTHEVVDATHDGVRVLNPGSATGAPPAAEATMMTVDAEAGTGQVTLHTA